MLRWYLTPLPYNIDRFELYLKGQKCFSKVLFSKEVVSWSHLGDKLPSVRDERFFSCICCLWRLTSTNFFIEEVVIACTSLCAPSLTCFSTFLDLVSVSCIEKIIYAARVPNCFLRSLFLSWSRLSAVLSSKSQFHFVGVAMTTAKINLQVYRGLVVMVVCFLPFGTVAKGGGERDRFFLQVCGHQAHKIHCKSGFSLRGGVAVGIAFSNLNVKLWRKS